MGIAIVRRGVYVGRHLVTAWRGLAINGIFVRAVGAIVGGGDATPHLVIADEVIAIGGVRSGRVLLLRRVSLRLPPIHSLVGEA